MLSVAPTASRPNREDQFWAEQKMGLGMDRWKEASGLFVLSSSQRPRHGDKNLTLPLPSPSSSSSSSLRRPHRGGRQQRGSGAAVGERPLRGSSGEEGVTDSRLGKLKEREGEEKEKARSPFNGVSPLSLGDATATDCF